MKLTGSILLRYLCRSGMMAEGGRFGQAGWLEGPLLYAGTEKHEAGWVYVVDQEAFFRPEEEIGEKVLFVFAGGKPEVLPEKGGWICLKNAADSAQVLNRIAEIYAFFQKWEEELHQIQYRFGTAGEMLRISRRVFSNPLMLLGEDLSVEEWASENGPPEERSGFFTSGAERMEIVRAILRDPDYLRNRVRTECYWGPEALLGFRVLCWNIIRNEDTQYTLWVMEDSDILTQADADLLQVLGFHVKFVLYHHEPRGGGRYENIGKVLRKVLTDRTQDYLDASNSLEELGWHREHLYLCLVYQLTYLDRHVLPTVTICRFMEEQYECSSFVLGDDIVTFFNLTLSLLTQEETQKQLRPFIRDSYLKAGFSRSIQGHMHLRHQYVQAMQALDVGSRKNPYRWIHYFDQLAFDYIMEQITRRLPGELLVHEGVLSLATSDRLHGTDYIHTLRVFLDQNQNAVRSAKTLYIHRSTFLYRMAKIREILGSELSDPDELLYLNLSLRLLEGP